MQQCKYLLGTSGILDRKVSTNADKIRSMSDEELAEWINSKDTCEQCAYTPGGLCMRNLVQMAY